MYKIYKDGVLIWHPAEIDKSIINPTLTLEANKVGTFSFKIFPSSFAYGTFEPFKTIVTVKDDDEILFKGRVFSDEGDFETIHTIEAEGLLGYFNDSVVRDYSYQGSVRGFLEFLINQHNAQVDSFQRFTLGTVTVTDPDSNDSIKRSSTTMPKTWTEITEKLIEPLGGYLIIRYEPNGNYIDYLDDYPTQSAQSVEYAINLTDLNTKIRPEKFATCIIPLGAYKDNGDGRVDIKSVNSASDYIIDAPTAAHYGKIYDTVEYDDISNPTTLLQKGIAELHSRTRIPTEITVQAVDLHLVDDEIQSFRVGMYVPVRSAPHNVNDRVLLKALSIPLFEPENCTITLGFSRGSYVANNSAQTRKSIAAAENAARALVASQWITATGLSSKIVTTSPDYSAPKYRKVTDHVYISGAIEVDSTYSNGDPLFTMPAGYQPPRKTVQAMVENTYIVIMNVSGGGIVSIASASDFSGNTVSISSVGLINFGIDYFTD